MHAQRASRPNIVLIVADDLGWRDVGYQGSNIRTPHIDSLARDGVRFTNLYAFPFCSPTRSALMTGRNPIRNGMVYTVIRPWSPHGLPVEEHILPETLKSAGYQTAIVGKWHLGHAHRKHLPNSRGFDHFYGFLNADTDYFEHTYAGILDWQRNGKGLREPGYTTDLLARESVEFIRSRDRSRPFFLYLPFGAVHSPIQAKPEDIAKYSDMQEPLRRTYAAMVTSMDSAIGRVLEAIDQEKIAENTVVMFISDNGGVPRHGSNHPYRAGKGTCFEGGIRIPGAARWPGRLPAGGRVEQVMTVMDLFPTLAAAAGVKPGNTLPLDGENLWPEVLSGKTRERGPLFFAVKKNETDERQYALRKGNWKLVQQFAAGTRVFAYLFDISTDPLEERDLAESKPEILRALQQETDEWIKLGPPGDVISSMKPHPGWVAPADFAEVAAKYE